MAPIKCCRSSVKFSAVLRIRSYKLLSRFYNEAVFILNENFISMLSTMGALGFAYHVDDEQHSAAFTSYRLVKPLSLVKKENFWELVLCARLIVLLMALSLHKYRETNTKIKHVYEPCSKLLLLFCLKTFLNVALLVFLRYWEGGSKLINVFLLVCF